MLDIVHNQQSEAKPQIQHAPFQLKLIDPYSTFNDGKPADIPYVIDGLLTQGGFSLLGGKPKQGKSSIARYEAVCVAKGLPFLGRNTTQGEVILVSLEDPINHVDNCLKALGYDPKTDARIRIVEKLSPNIDESIEAIGNVLETMPYTGLVVIDTLAKLLRVKDMNDYSGVLPQVEKVHNLARRFARLHVQGLAHCKKVKSDDVFDSLLGSTALRGEPDTSLAVYQEQHQRVFATETRIGRNIEPTILTATLVESAGANVVTDFALTQLYADWQAKKAEKKEAGRKATFEERIIRFLLTRDNYWAYREMVLADVEGNRQGKIEAINVLVQAGVLKVTGVERSPVNPLTLHLDQTSLHMHDFLNSHAGNIQ